MLRWLVGEAVEQLGRHAQSGVPHAARLEDALGLRHQEAGRARVLLVGLALADSDAKPFGAFLDIGHVKRYQLRPARGQGKAQE